ncbi:MAG: hypothetical protein ABSG93_12785 [Solirubrobacteraceae bacterium]|jgi:hypothetical protein
MIKVNVFTNEIDPDGELVDCLAATFEVREQELTVTDGDARLIQVGIPVYSERYGRLIDFDTDGEEWARNLPSAYRNGAVNVQADEVSEPLVGSSMRRSGIPALASQQARQHS